MAPIRSPKQELHVPIAKVFDAKKESTSMAKFQSILLSPRRLRDQLYCSNEAKFILNDTGLTRAMVHGKARNEMYRECMAGDAQTERRFHGNERRN